MKTRPALFLLLCACILVAVLLLRHRITPLAGSTLFALALVAAGLVSHGFRR